MRYILHPGWILGKYIGPTELAIKNNLDPRECLVMYEPETIKGYIAEPEDVHIWPEEQNIT